MGEAFDITLDMHETEEREALRDAFIRGVTVSFRGRRVSVVGQFVRRHPDLTWQVTYRLHPEPDQVRASDCSSHSSST